MQKNNFIQLKTPQLQSPYGISPTFITMVDIDEMACSAEKRSMLCRIYAEHVPATPDKITASISRILPGAGVVFLFYQSILHQ